MESNDVFAQSLAENDPFEDSTFDDVRSQRAALDEELPVVDREGNRIEPQAEEAQPSTPSAQDTPQEAPAAAPAAGTDPSGGWETLAPEKAAQEAAAYEERTMGNGEVPDPTPEPVSSGATDGPTAPAASAGPTETAEPDPTPSSSPSSAVAAAEDDEEAAPPEETKDKGGRVVKRRYLIFRVEGPGKLTQVAWYEDKHGKLAERGAGTKRQRVLLARHPEDALKFGFAAVGAPPEGAHLVAVAVLHFQPRKIKPMPPEPLRQRLQIT